MHGDVGSGADGYAHVCLCQGGGVVDAVAHHGHQSIGDVGDGGGHRRLCRGGVARYLQLPYPVGLAVGPDLSDHRVDADFRGDAFGDLRLVSRQHHRADASGSKRCYRLLGTRLDAVLRIARLGVVGVVIDGSDGDRPGLVEHGSDVAGLLQGPGGCDQHAVRGAEAGRRGHR